MSDIKISVIIPSYKPQDYLWDCLWSLKRQSFPNSEFEILLILNGDKEPYYSKIEVFLKENFADKDNIRLFYSAFGSVSNARNVGLDNARGEFITFIDDDDFISPSYLEELYACAKEGTVSLCYPLSFDDGTCNYERLYITNDYLKNKDKNQCSVTSAKRFFAGPCMKLIHRNIIGNRRFDVQFKNGEDSIFMFLISDRIKNVSFTTENAIYYRRMRAGSALLRKKKFIEIIGNMCKTMHAYNIIFYKAPSKYNTYFYMTRLLGSVHGAIEQFKIRLR